MTNNYNNYNKIKRTVLRRLERLQKNSIHEDLNLNLNREDIEEVLNSKSLRKLEQYITGGGQ